MNEETSKMLVLAIQATLDAGVTTSQYKSLVETVNVAWRAGMRDAAAIAEQHQGHPASLQRNKCCRDIKFAILTKCASAPTNSHSD